MQPIHEGLEKVSLYDGSQFRSVTVCLDSGKFATAACGKDVRGIGRTSSAYCYAEDMPSGSCDKHVLVNWCTTGSGVATEWCTKFSGEEGYTVKIEERSLVKMNSGEVGRIKAAAGVGLNPQYSLDYYVYLTDGNWHGFHGNANPKVEEPYVVCTVHTEEAWKKYDEEKKKAEEEAKREEEEAKKEEEAAKPTEPVQPTEPAETQPTGNENAEP